MVCTEDRGNMNRLDGSEQSATAHTEQTERTGGGKADNGEKAVDVVTARYVTEEHKFRQERFEQALRRASSHI